MTVVSRESNFQNIFGIFGKRFFLRRSSATNRTILIGTELKGIDPFV